MADILSQYPFLRDKTQISLAEFHLAMGCGYLQAKAAMQKLRRMGVISEKNNGLHSEINVRYFSRRDLSEDEAYHLAMELSTHDRMTLDVVQRELSKGGYHHDEKDDFDGNIASCLQTLMVHDLIYSFDGKLYPALSDSSCKMIREMDSAKMNAPSLAFLALPLGEALAEGNLPEDVLERLHLFPDSCKDFAMDYKLAAKNNGELPKVPPVDLSDEEECKALLTVDMMRAIVSADYDWDEVSRYVRAARMCLRTMQMYSVWGTLAMEAAEEAINSLSSMTMGDIRELRRWNEDDEDDD